MRIDRLELLNFKKFKEQTFEFPRPAGSSGEPDSFHVLIGENGSGKTSVLDAAAVALGVWLVNPPDSLLVNSRRSLTAGQKRGRYVERGDRVQFEDAAGAVAIKASGRVAGHEGVQWEQRIGQGKSGPAIPARKKCSG